MNPAEEEKFYRMSVKIRKMEENISIILGNLEDERYDNEQLRNRIKELEDKLSTATKVGICSAAPVLDSQLNREECKDGNHLGKE